MIYLLVISLWVWIFYKIKSLELRHIKEREIFEKWLFDSLYSIDNKVLLPTEKEKPLTTKKAEVYKPESQPEYEFHKNGL